MDISVIMLTCNRAARCRETLLHNAHALKKYCSEIILVNNGREPVGCPDGFPAEVAFREITMPSNKGAAARNSGIQIARSDILLMLDDDAYLADHMIGSVLECLRTPQAPGTVALRVENMQGREEACLLPSVFHGCAVAFLRRALIAVGGYPEKYIYYGEEYDLAFRLYQNQWRAVMCNTPDRVRHVRDSAGRSKDRIIHYLVRNNLFTWGRFLPRPLLAPAVVDTWQRYYLVARKEKALSGFRKGVAAGLFSLARGRRHPRPLHPAALQQALLIEAAAQWIPVMKEAAKPLVICGIGKFPRVWQRQMRAAGLRIIAYYDMNRCWKGQAVNGVPVQVLQADTPLPHTANALYLCGFAGVGENLEWARILKRAGLRPLAGNREEFAATGTFDLPRLGPFQLFNA